MLTCTQWAGEGSLRRALLVKVVRLTFKDRGQNLDRANGQCTGPAVEIKLLSYTEAKGFPGGASGEEPACQCRKHKRHWFDPWVDGEDPLEKEMATHCSILAWRIPRTEEPGGLQFIV